MMTRRSKRRSKFANSYLVAGFVFIVWWANRFFMDLKPTFGGANYADWGSIKHFNSKEFDSKDRDGKGVGTGKYMNHEFVKKLDSIREASGFPLHVNSGYRTKAHNTWLKNNGYPASNNSAHMKGLAADLHCPTLYHLERVVSIARSLGIRRIGQYKNADGTFFCHLDIDGSKSHQGEWYYSKGKKTGVPWIP